MAQITITIPDSVLAQVETALCNSANLTVNGPNAKQVVINYIMGIIRNYQANQAVQGAAQTAINTVNSTIQIT